MSWVAAAIGGSALLGAFGSSKSAKAQENAAETSAATQRYMYDTSREDMAPYREAGSAAINQMQDLIGLQGADARGEAVNQFYQDPGYQFRFNEGQRALENSAAARGGLFSGNTGRELVGFGQGMGSQEYGNYWNRLAGLSGTGQTSTNAMANMGLQTGRGIGNANLAAGQARGSGYIGMGDSLSSGMSNWAGYQGWNNGPSWLNAGGNFAGTPGPGRPPGFANTTTPTFGYNPASLQWS